MNEEMKNYPEEEVLTCLIDGILGDKKSKQIQEHLAICNRCKEVVDAKKKMKQEKNNSL